MRRLVMLATLLALMLPTIVSAEGPGVDQFGFRKRHAPRAAPWFLYWPYDAYWGTPAPTGYPYPAAPMTPGQFPNQGYGYGYPGMPSYPTYPGYYPAYGSVNGYGQ